MATTTAFEEVISLDELKANKQHSATVDGTSVALFYHEEEIRCVALACPHMGFPLTEGSVEDGILTCHWHHARFELSCGDTFDPWADDVEAYPVEVRDGTVYVNPNPASDSSPADRWADRLETGLEQNLRLVTAKAAIGLVDAGVDEAKQVETGVLFGTRYREGGWSSGLTILTLLANVLPDLHEEDRKRALYHGNVHVAMDCADQPPKFDQDAFDTRDVATERLKSWFRNSIDVRDADGAERCLRTAIAAGSSQSELAGMLVAAATDHRYLDTGHTMDFVNKACEALDIVGWEHAEHVLPSLVGGLATADRAEERSSWRQPIDLAERVDETFTRLDELVAAGSDETWSTPDDFTDTLHSDDPNVVIEALETAIGEGATVSELAAAVAFAAGTRVAQFATANEFSDWNTVHHTFTYANAVHRLSERTDATELYRGVFDAAVNVYLDRFLNTPPAPIPETGESDGDTDALLDDLLATFEREGQVNEAGRLTAHYLDAGGDVARLRQRLGEGLLREDAGFHTYQALEAGFAQCEERPETEQRTLLVAVARYLAAHFPTRREREQTFTIAARLQRGEKIHEA